jgi:SlyX protein
MNRDPMKRDPIKPDPIKPDVEQRITELEVQLAHVQRWLEQLNEVVTAQALEADRTQRRIVELQQQVRALKARPEPAIDPLDEKPPHY